jgi:hypothetical protein
MCYLQSLSPEKKEKFAHEIILNIDSFFLLSFELQKRQFANEYNIDRAAIL